MDALQNQEAVLRAGVGAEKMRAGSAEVKSTAKAIAEKVRQEGADKTLSDALRVKPVSEGALTQSIERNLRVDRDPDTGARKPTPDQIVRLDRVKNAASEANEYLKQGYDRLTTTQKDALKIKVESALRRSLPQVDELLTKMSDPERDALIESKLRDPEFALKVQSLLEGAAQQTSDIAIPEDLKTQLAAADKAVQDKARELRDKTAERTAVGLKFDEEYKAPLRGIKNKHTEIRDLEAEIRTPAFATELRANESSKKTLESEIKRMETKRKVAKSAGGDLTVGELTELATKQADKDEFDDKIAEANAKTARRDELLRDKATAEQEITSLDNEVLKITDEEVDATKKKLLAQAEIDDVKLSSAGTTESDYVNSLENVWDTAMTQYLGEKFSQAEEVRQNLIEEEKAKTEDELKQKFLTELQGRWNMGKADKYKLDKAAVNKDYDALLAGGPRMVLDEMLLKAGVTDPDKFLKENPEFATHYEAEVVTTLISKKLQSGKITENEARLIADSPWGGKAIENALSKNDSAREQINSLRERGIIKSKADMLKWLALILGGGLVMAAVPLAGVAVAAAPLLGSATGATMTVGAGVAAAGIGGITAEALKD